jgi:hypothetical protein
MQAGMGVRISVTLRETLSSYKKGIAVVSHDTITIDGQTLSYIEHDAIDLLKMLKVHNFIPNIQRSIIYMAFEDMVINLPLLLCKGNDAVCSADKIQRILRKLIDRMIVKEKDRLLSYNLGIAYGDLTACFSVAGHITDIYKWLATSTARMPASLEAIPSWCENAAAGLNKTYSIQSDNPPLNSLMQKTGILLFDRRFLDSDSYRLKIDEETNRINADLIINKKDTKTLGALSASQISPTSLHWVRKAQCSKCSKDYFKCGCSKYHNDGTHLIMQDAPFVGLFWTNGTCQ